MWCSAAAAAPHGAYLLSQLPACKPPAKAALGQGAASKVGAHCKHPSQIHPLIPNPPPGEAHSGLNRKKNKNKRSLWYGTPNTMGRLHACTSSREVGQLSERPKTMQPSSLTPQQPGKAQVRKHRLHQPLQVLDMVGGPAAAAEIGYLLAM